MNQAVFQYQQIDAYSMMPIIPLRLENANNVVQTQALIDSGASVNVMPYQVGLDLGFNWEKAPVGKRLAGTLAASETRLLVARAYLADLRMIELGFVWVQSQHSRLLLGQNNFFKFYEVCFSRKHLTIKISEE
jgi:hypothetical protein